MTAKYGRTSGLREVARLITASPALPTPAVVAFPGHAIEVTWHLHHHGTSVPAQERIAAAIRRTIGEDWTSRVDDMGRRVWQTRLHDGIRVHVEMDPRGQVAS